jgi:hypothetical protein
LVYAVVDSAAAMREALRRRIGEVGITLETLEELSGATTRGYATKILGEPPLKRAQLEIFLWLIEAPRA